MQTQSQYAINTVDALHHWRYEMIDAAAAKTGIEAAEIQQICDALSFHNDSVIAVRLAMNCDRSVGAGVTIGA